MKLKILTTLCVVTLALGMTACGKKASSPTPESARVTETPTKPPKPTATKVPPEPTNTVEPTATQEPTAEPTSRFDEGPCPFNVPAGAPVKCGFVAVPQDHRNPDGPNIRLAVVIIEDHSDAHQPDPVVLLSGGPGEKTVENAPAIAPLLDPIHPNRDIILFDQRGAGLSEPALECPEFLKAQFDLLDEADQDVSAEVIFDSLITCRDRLVSEGHNLSVYNTVQNAADVDAIRVALGYDQINLYGGSYGSLLAQAVMRDHPAAIRSVVINSVLPLEKSFFVEASVTTANAVMHLLDACAEDEGCSSAYPDLQDVLFEVVDRLNTEPAPVTLTNPLDGESYDALLTGDSVLGNLVTFLYLTQMIPVLPQAIANVYEGNYELMTQLSSTRLALLDLTSRGMMFSVLCTDDLIGRQSEDLLNILAELPEQMVGDTDLEVAIEYGAFAVCENWPVEEADPSVKEPLVSDIRTLVLAGEFDPVTPPEYGQLVASYLSNSTFFEFPGVGHDVLSNACARAMGGAFIDDPTQPPDATCLAEMTGVAFDLPLEPTELVLEPFVSEVRGFGGLVPVGWEELAPANLRRGHTALDPTYFVLEATFGTAASLLAEIVAQLQVDENLEPVRTEEAGSFTWDFYAFDYRGNPADLALAEEGEKAFFVFMISAADEHDLLYDELFIPAVEAMAPLDQM